MRGAGGCRHGPLEPDARRVGLRCGPVLREDPRRHRSLHAESTLVQAPGVIEGNAVGEDTVVCPRTRLPLRRCSLAEASAVVSPSAPLVARAEGDFAPLGPTLEVMLCADGSGAYPV